MAGEIRQCFALAGSPFLIPIMPIVILPLRQTANSPTVLLLGGERTFWIEGTQGRYLMIHFMAAIPFPVFDRNAGQFLAGIHDIIERSRTPTTSSFSGYALS